MPHSNHYEVLAVEPDASLQEIEDAYASRRLGASERSLERVRLDEAHAVLRDAVRRQEYDSAHGFGWGRRGRRRAASSRSLATPLPSPVATPVVPAATPSVLSGADLRRIREERGITLEEIGSKTKLTRTLLQHFENDRYDRLPPPVYIRSFLQQYATAVGLDPRRTADAYLSRLPRAR